MTKTPPTNEMLLRKLIKEINPYEAMIVRERLVRIAEITLDAIKKDPKSYNNPIFNHEFYVTTCNHIIQVLGFEKHKTEKK